jgi:hypothetical protein
MGKWGVHQCTLCDKLKFKDLPPATKVNLVICVFQTANDGSFRFVTIVLLGYLLYFFKDNVILIYILNWIHVSDCGLNIIA